MQEKIDDGLVEGHLILCSFKLDRDLLVAAHHKASFKV